MIKEEFYFDSRDGENRIHAVRYTPDDGKAKAVVQVVHGMAEYVERYEELAKYLSMTEEEVKEVMKISLDALSVMEADIKQS